MFGGNWQLIMVGNKISWIYLPWKNSKCEEKKIYLHSVDKSFVCVCAREKINLWVNIQWSNPLINWKHEMNLFPIFTALQMQHWSYFLLSGSAVTSGNYCPLLEWKVRVSLHFCHPTGNIYMLYERPSERTCDAIFTSINWLKVESVN